MMTQVEVSRSMPPALLLPTSRPNRTGNCQSIFLTRWAAASPP
jgi:hypothetical protein